MKKVKDICAAIGFLLVMFLAACADGLMNEYGMKVTFIVGLAILGVAGILIQISNLPEGGR